MDKKATNGASEPQDLLIQLNDEAIREGRIDGFSKSGGIDLTISDFYKERALVLMAPTLGAIRGWLSSVAEECRQLCDLIRSLFDDFIDAPITKEVTYRRVFYLGRLLCELDAIRMTNPSSALHGALQKTLKQLNLNTEAYYNYCIARYSNIIARIPDVSDKLAELKGMKKKLLNSEVWSGYIYQMALPDLKHQLQDWLRTRAAELADQPIKEVNKPSRMDLTDEQFKINTLMGMDVLAILFKAAIKGGLIAEPCYEALFRFVSRHFSTPTMTDFKATSFKSRYGEQPTRKGLTAALRLLIAMEEHVKERMKDAKNKKI
ncbi:hypothetical protein [Chitinophaga defluvii]|uniref:RteC protein n=1 Tax=Chitinophaga defluvii TaxID=3163343 RepID=A0ABV2TC02_9BACT